MLASKGELLGGRYRIERMLGEGGFSEVHLGIDETLEREVAIKLMSFKNFSPPGIDPAAVRKDMTERFQNEARMVAKLKDPSTITLFDVGTTEHGALYMVLEYIKGATLRTTLNIQGKLDVFAATRVLTRTLESLREAHLHGLMHRDIKPENIMIFKHIDDPWCIRVIDFGIAKGSEDNASAMTAAGILTGTLRYVPPERMNQQPLSPASDLYSLGCVMYFALTGEEIFRDCTSAIQMIQAQRSKESVTLPEALAIPDALRKVVNKLLHKDPTTRYRAAQQVLDDLEMLSVELQIAAHHLSLDDVKAAVAMTQAMPAIGLGLDESSAATMQMSAADIPGLSMSSDRTIPVQLSDVPPLRAPRKVTGPGFREMDAMSTGAEFPVISAPLVPMRGTSLDRGITSAHAVPEPSIQESSRSPIAQFQALDKNKKFLIGLIVMAFLLLVMFSVIIAIIVITRNA